MMQLKAVSGTSNETSRALIQSEIENYQNLLNKALLQQNQLNNIPLEISNKQSNSVVWCLPLMEFFYRFGMGENFNR